MPQGEEKSCYDTKTRRNESYHSISVLLFKGLVLCKTMERSRDVGNKRCTSIFSSKPTEPSQKVIYFFATLYSVGRFFYTPQANSAPNMVTEKNS
ncbi:hypothetical protein V6N11_067188 [Hibiscus sabdariffa]|uniref:Uncharacterized protein n=1 Tax=Hibiscus sabdariffa TaxID=183260 RepID=A0ABR2SQM7_9ROSI